MTLLRASVILVGGEYAGQAGIPTFTCQPMLYCHLQSQEDIDKKESGVFIPHIPWTISQFGVFGVSN